MDIHFKTINFPRRAVRKTQWQALETPLTIRATIVCTSVVQAATTETELSDQGFYKPRFCARFGVMFPDLFHEWL